ncbi:hypothetical protein PG990_011719 [Apiospora arundinis]
MVSTYEDQRYPVRPGITPVNSGLSDTTLIGDENDTGVKDDEKTKRLEIIECKTKGDDNIGAETPKSMTSKLRLRGQICSGLCSSLYPIDLYKMGCHLWHVIQDYWWLWELATMATSFVSMTAVIVVLAVEDGKSLDDWSFPIQPNSLISIFITIAKSAIMTVLTGAISQSMWMQFEQRSTPLMRIEEIQEAGRGPWGSMKLLAALMKGKRYNLLAILGAIITVITLAFDPFVQQVMSFPSRAIVVKDGKAVFRSTQTLQDLDMTLVQGALLGGFYRNPQITNYTCTESSCTWPTITTLGVCSSCQDLTSRADVQCSTAPGPLMPSSASDRWTFETTNCNYTVGGNITMSTYIQTMSFPKDENGHQAEYASQWTETKLLPQEGYKNYSDKNLLGKMILPEVNYWFTTVLSYSTSFDSQTTPLPKVTPDLLAPRIIACGLRPCGQVWETPTVANGKLNNNGVPTSLAPVRVQFNDAGLYRWYQMPNRSDYSDVLRVVGDQEAYDSNFPGNGTFIINRGADLTTLLAQMYRATSLEGNEDFGDAFPEKARGIYGLTNAVFDVDVDVENRKHQAATTASSTVRSPTASFERAARGLSEYVRNNGRNNYDDTDGGGYLENQSEEDWNGKAWRQETYIEVRWAFLTLPLLVLVATWALLGVAVGRSMGKGAQIWKSSGLALLFHDVYTEAAAERECVADYVDRIEKGQHTRLHKQKVAGRWRCEADSIQTMNEKAEKVNARLAMDGDSFRFIVID